MPENIMMYFYFGIFLLVAVAYAVRLFKRKFSPVTVISATVVYKQKVESFSKYSGSGKSVRYAITFSGDGKKLSFYVSEFSYSGYRIGETGTLTYKNDKLIDFS